MSGQDFARAQGMCGELINDGKDICILAPGHGGHAPTPTAPLPQRLREAAEVIEQINAMAGMGVNCSVSPLWLRREAAVLEMETFE